MHQMIDFICVKKTKVGVNEAKENVFEQCDEVLKGQFRGEKHKCPKCGSPMKEGFGATQPYAVFRHNDTRMPKG